MENVETTKGTVVNVSGEVVVVDTKGAEHALQPGEQVSPGDMLIVRANSEATLDLGKAQPETVPEDTTAILEVDPNTGEITLVFHSVSAEALDVADIQAAILAGQDPTQILEETAAGNTPPTSSGFSEFQAVDRTAEEVLARAGYDTDPENWQRDPYVDHEADIFIPPSLYSVADVEVSEGGMMTFTVTRTGGTGAATIDYATSIETTDNTETEDFTATSGTLTFAAGEVSKTFTVQTTQDDVFEGPESFSVNLSNASNDGEIVDGTAVGTIVDDGTGPGPNPDDDTTSFSVADASVSEGGLMTFTVTRTGDAAEDQTVKFTTSIESNDNTDTNDFTANSGTLIFAPGEMSKTFTVQTTGDLIDEADETFTVTLSDNSPGSAIGDATAVGTIEDNDAPTFSFVNPADESQSGIIVPEGQDAVFGVKVTDAAAGSTLVLSLADGTALDADYFNSHSLTSNSVSSFAVGAPATGYFQYSTDDGATWTDISGAINVPEGDTDLLVRTDTIIDFIDELDETFTLNGTLTSVGVDYSDTAVATIVDGDVPTVTLGDPADMTQGGINVSEGDDAVFGVEVTHAGAGSTLTLSLADGTALDADYFSSPAAGNFQYSTDGGTTWTDVSGAISLSEGDSSLQVRTDTIDDLLDEADETFSLNGTLTSLGTDYSASSEATIVDNDEPVVTFGDPADMTQNGIAVQEGDDAIFGVD
ncbi:retention module-containing protein, partial [Amphritea sp.]|uniref:retention module-containing protein n=1 Tax=Amphritea sp. TaxID=1872502 RepID=UPI003A956456